MPRSSSDEERRLGGTRSQRRWIWSVDDETGQGAAAEVEGVVFASVRGSDAGGVFVSEVGNLSEVTADFDSDFGAVAGK